MPTVFDTSSTSSKRPLCILQAHTFYRSYLEQFYSKNVHAANLTSAQQTNLLIKDGLAAIHILPPYLKNLDCKPQLVIINCTQIQQAWMREHHLRIPADTQNAEAYILAAQITTLKPDVLYLVGDHCQYGANFISQLSHRPPVIVGWRGADVSHNTDWTGYDAILSGLTPILDLAPVLGAKQGIWFAPGMPKWIAKAVETIPHDIDVVFAGSISPSQHLKRLALLDIVAKAAQKHGFSLALHLTCAPYLITEAMRPYIRPPVFGLEMHKALRRGRIVLDDRAYHGLVLPNGQKGMDLGGEDTINMRIFEGTGGGSFVLTEFLTGLHKLFDPQKEVGTYSTSNELIEKILFFLENTEERTKIAAAGQKRCLGEWSMQNRAKAFLNIIENIYYSKKVTDNVQDGVCNAIR